MCHLICYQNRLFFGNMLTLYLRKEEVDEEPEFDVIIPATLRGTEITSIQAKDDDDGSLLTGVERQACVDSFMALFYGIFGLQLQIGGRPATPKEQAHLNTRFLLNTHARVGWD